VAPSSVRLVDAHVHVFPPEIIAGRETYLSDRRFGALYASPKAKMAGVEDVLVHMDECGVEVSLILGFAFEDLGLCRETNNYVLEAVRANPTRLAGLGAGRQSWSVALTGGRVDVESWLHARQTRRRSRVWLHSRGA
jgi:hypothetical protein